MNTVQMNQEIFVHVIFLIGIGAMVGWACEAFIKSMPPPEGVMWKGAVIGIASLLALFLFG